MEEINGEFIVNHPPLNRYRGLKWGLVRALIDYPKRFEHYVTQEYIVTYGRVGLIRSSKVND